MSNKKQLLISVVVLVAVVAVAVVAYRALSAGQMSSSISAGSASTSSSSIDQSQALSQSPGNSSSANGSGSATSGGSSGNSQALPSFSVLDSSGAKVSSDSVIGKPTFIGFWATWCPNCVSEAPDIQKLYDTYGDRVNFMMIDCVDGQRETVDIAKQWIESKGYTYPVYFDTTNQASLALRVQYLPTIYLVDAQGNVTSMKIGSTSFDAMATALDGLLAS